ncbi:hypothetical protein DSO57_1028829 [Entomophthora muscae]|uniref:Uncharacterized protein n=1 Tax=Entomophthora muscae TaxID=34485 RepID=A0ACC2SE92_9FUNG|nr:hypothetical protein DSO57_1028829 [Entomophthora muscae]
MKLLLGVSALACGTQALHKNLDYSDRFGISFMNRTKPNRPNERESISLRVKNRVQRVQVGAPLQTFLDNPLSDTIDGILVDFIELKRIVVAEYSNKSHENPAFVDLLAYLSSSLFFIFTLCSLYFMFEEMISH